MLTELEEGFVLIGFMAELEARGQQSSKLMKFCLSKMLSKSLMLKVTYLSVWFPPGSFNFAPGQEWTHPAGRSWSYSATVWLV